MFGSHIMAALSADREGFLAVSRMCCGAPLNVLIHFLPLGELGECTGECPMASGTVCPGSVSCLEESPYKWRRVFQSNNFKCNFVCALFVLQVVFLQILFNGTIYIHFSFC